MRQTCTGTFRTTTSGWYLQTCSRNLLRDRLRHQARLRNLLGDDVRVPHLLDRIFAAGSLGPIQTGTLIDGLSGGRIDGAAARLPGQPGDRPAGLEHHLARGDIPGRRTASGTSVTGWNTVWYWVW